MARLSAFQVFVVLACCRQQRVTEGFVSWARCSLLRGKHGVSIGYRSYVSDQVGTRVRPAAPSFVEDAASKADAAVGDAAVSIRTALHRAQQCVGGPGGATVAVAKASTSTSQPSPPRDLTPPEPSPSPVASMELSHESDLVERAARCHDPRALATREKCFLVRNT